MANVHTLALLSLSFVSSAMIGSAQAKPAVASVQAAGPAPAVCSDFSSALGGGYFIGSDVTVESDLIVEEDTLCSITGVVDGNVLVKNDASLVLSRATITGQVKAGEGRSDLQINGATILQDVDIKDAQNVFIQDSSVCGSIAVKEANGTSVVIQGNTLNATGCNGGILEGIHGHGGIHGGILVEKCNVESIEIRLNKVANRIKVARNQVGGDTTVAENDLQDKNVEIKDNTLGTTSGSVIVLAGNDGVHDMKVEKNIFQGNAFISANQSSKNIQVKGNRFLGASVSISENCAGDMVEVKENDAVSGINCFGNKKNCVAGNGTATGTCG